MLPPAFGPTSPAEKYVHTLLPYLSLVVLFTTPSHFLGVHVVHAWGNINNTILNHISFKSVTSEPEIRNYNTRLALILSYFSPVAGTNRGKFSKRFVWHSI